MRGKDPIIPPPKPRPPYPSSRIGAHQPAPAPRGAAARKPAFPTGFSVPLALGPYQNNGATPWFANLGLGSPAQPLKIALDTGTNLLWITSSLCPSGGCQHYGNCQFNYGASSSFQWVSQTPQTVSFGPWGSMSVEIGHDNYMLPNGPVPGCAFYLAANYSGEQFAQLDWDGGIGIPSGSDFVSPDVTNFVAELMNQGLIDPANPYISFCTNPASGEGSVLCGGYDPTAYDPDSGIYLPWTAYTEFPGVKYIWTTGLNNFSVGGTVVATNVQFCLDSGSSQFKGDNNIMNTTLGLVSPSGPPVTMQLGQAGSGGLGAITVPPSIYNVNIQAGPQQGQTLPQFNPLGLTNLVLVGSVLMDQLYTIYTYDVTETPAGYHLAPVGIYIFNRLGGANPITSLSAKKIQLPRRAVHRA